MNYRIVIDPGHGGDDPGASGNGIIEKNKTLEISKYMYDRFNELGVPVYLTRDSDVTLNPSDRVKEVLSFSETRHFRSIRDDLWTFKLNHMYINQISGGKVFLEIIIKKYNYNYKEKEVNYSSIIQVLDSLTFNIEFNINYNSFRSHNNSILITYDTLYKTQEIIIPPEYYNINTFTEIPFIIELLVSKNFDNISKLDEGQYNGIKNEGATCYMNSMLQTLYSIYPFKKAVFQIPTDKDDYSSIVLSLQRLFYDLITNHSPVSARNLINSFGWTREQIQIQHDVQEFNQLLIEEMEKIPEIVETQYTLGAFGILTKLYARDDKHLMKLLNGKIAEIEGVSNTVTLTALEERINRSLPIE